MECRICSTLYDPASGDAPRSVDPGTGFHELPETWRCPGCAAPKVKFDEFPDALAIRSQQVSEDMTARVAELECEYRTIADALDRDAATDNPALHVEAVSFRLVERHPVGVLITPWMMQLMLLPAIGRPIRKTELGTVRFPSGQYRFLQDSPISSGDVQACPLFSPMWDFSSQAQAVGVAEAVMEALLDPIFGEVDALATVVDLFAAKADKAMRRHGAGNAGDP